MTSCFDIANLEPVSETLLVTAYLRSLESIKTNGIIKDYKSVEIIKSLDYDFSQYYHPLNQALIAIRTEIFDQIVSNFITQYPETTVVNLGTGLCTRFFRLDNGSIHWIGIDFPVVEPLWNNLLGKTERHQYYPYSVLDLDWMTKVKSQKPDKVLFIAEGLLMFLSEIEVRYLLQNIRDNFPNSELIFDALGVFLAQNSKRSSKVLGIDVSYQWGIQNLSEIETWGKRIKLVNQWHYLDRHKNRLSWLGLLSYLPALRRQVKIGHLKFS